MSDEKKLGELLFENISNNLYLQKLYQKILTAYAKKTLGIADSNIELNEKCLSDLLRFSDLLSKSNHDTLAEEHKMWAQEIIVLLNYIYPDNHEIRAVGGSVFSNTNNTRGLDILHTHFDDSFFLDRLYLEYKREYLRIPAQKNLHFFLPQKQVYDHFSSKCFSYSAPTSMGKSFLMRMYIKEQIEKGANLSFAIIVPTKALINEVSQKIIQDDLQELLKKQNYKVITAVNDIALEGKHNFIYVLTPERLLYMLIAFPNLKMDYLFIDEAHKLSSKNSRAPFYYKVVDILRNRECPPNFIFASPNIPNPEVYLQLLTDSNENTSKNLAIAFSPVTQIKFLLDLKSKIVSVYNSYTDEAVTVAKVKHTNATLEDFLFIIETRNRKTKNKKIHKL